MKKPSNKKTNNPSNVSYSNLDFKGQIFKIPNIVTMIRILLVPVFIISLYLPVKNQNLISAGLFLFIALTDSLDGFLARTLNQVTDLGKILDPLADKLLIMAALIFLVGRSPVGVPAWVAYLILLREFMMIGLKSINPNIIVASNWWGKIMMVFTVLGILAVLLNFEWSIYLLTLAVILSWISGIIYAKQGIDSAKRISV